MTQWTGNSNIILHNIVKYEALIKLGSLFVTGCGLCRRSWRFCDFQLCQLCGPVGEQNSAIWLDGRVFTLATKVAKTQKPTVNKFSDVIEVQSRDGCTNKQTNKKDREIKRETKIIYRPVGLREHCVSYEKQIKEFLVHVYNISSYFLSLSEERSPGPLLFLSVSAFAPHKLRSFRPKSLHLFSKNFFKATPAFPISECRLWYLRQLKKMRCTSFRKSSSPL